MTTIYYLDWEAGRRLNDELLIDIRMGDFPKEIPKECWEKYWRRVAGIENKDLGVIWAEWNNGSGVESEEFREARIRSMSVGDIIETDGRYYIVADVGFEDITDILLR